MDHDKIKNIIEAALMAADGPLTQERLVKLFKRGEVPIDELRTVIKEVLQTLTDECEDRGYELKRVSSGYRYQVRQDYSEWVSRLWEEKPPRYSRALMETLALIAYKQPVTRGDVEQVRGVAVSTNIMRQLLERDWVRVVGKGNGSARNYGLWYNPSASGFLFQQYGSSNINIYSTAALQTGEWYHIAGVRENGTAKLFVNDKLNGMLSH